MTISEDRIIELQNYFWNETTEGESQEWRDNLSKEELELVNKWDESYTKAITMLYNEFDETVKKFLK